ncbi:hypothetical protein [Paractinoplanes lichenicola]|uniref:Uncharacterized protein n=1 Tax=Paractinoplanes lichenicola TaxID=2802976 RepID=A0ABS1VMD0_9ACTN|nr:hypothetical protein [Actinoplanes lichenicola]MBL7255887.1 hypothetical protein [Actinoplanes lichenicola]
MADIELRTGDVLEISCPFTEAGVIGVSRWDVSLRWPWWRADPDADGFEWNGAVAVGKGTGDLFSTEPAAEMLLEGSLCRVGIEPTVVHVIEVQSFDPPLVTGRLPRPRREIVVLRRGVSEIADAVEQGTGLDPDDDIPMAVKLLFRPYAFLNLGADVADHHGRAWRFDGPWQWHAYDQRPGTPVWPLTPLTAAQEQVVRATETGSHEAELDKWRSAAQAEPPDVMMGG